MLICVIGFPASGYTGFPLISIVDLEAAADVWSALGAATLGLLDDVGSSSFFTGAGLAGESPDVDRCGIFRMSLYLDCLIMAC